MVFVVAEVPWYCTGFLQLGHLSRLQHGLWVQLCPERRVAGLEVGVHHRFSPRFRRGSAHAAHRQGTCQTRP